MVTFTLPAQLRTLARRHQRAVYNLLFRSAASALQTLAADPRFIGGQIGMVGVLHTWGRDLSYHPHIHFLVPGGGLSADGQTWRPSAPNLLVHVKPLGVLFRGKFRQGLAKLGLSDALPAEIWSQKWVVHSQQVGRGQHALKYLAPYIFRVAISNNRIVSAAEGQVTFRYKPSGSSKMKRCTLPALEFLRRFLQHVLPKGFVKVRYYGLFAPGQRHRRQQARQLLAGEDGQPDVSAEENESQTEPEGDKFCPQCGQLMGRRIVSPVSKPP